MLKSVDCAGSEYVVNLAEKGALIWPASGHDLQAHCTRPILCVCVCVLLLSCVFFGVTMV